MSRDQKRLDDYLSHIRQAIERIHRYPDDMDEAGFLQDEMTQDAVIRNFEVIGEAARNIEQQYPEFASEHAEIPWEDAYFMRNRFAHGYFSVDLEIVWKAIQRDIPELGQQVRQLHSR